MLQFSKQIRSEKEHLAIEKRKCKEEERKTRIFDPKVRTIGVDVNALNQQVQQKKTLSELETLRDQYYHEIATMETRNSVLLQKKLQQFRQTKLQELETFRKTYQKAEFRREWDLNDPNVLKNDKPIRMGDDDSRMTVSCCQKFHGEDIFHKERTKAQKRQMKHWVDEQNEEKKQKEMLEREECLMYEQRAEELAFLSAELEKQKQLLRAEKMKALKEFNLEQAKCRIQNDAIKRLQEEEDKLEEIHNQLNSDFLCENFSSTINAHDPCRFKPYHFKALRPDQYEQIMKERQKQIEDKNKLIEYEKLAEEEYLLEQKLNLRKAIELEREKARQRKQKNMELYLTHKEQESQAREKEKHLKDLYENRATEDFFSQFNTTSR